jgi:4-hydroxy-tetrahydrodipicolinate reductase
VNYESAVDKITLSHEAKSRDGFALGAIYAANWLKDKKGVYHFPDVMALKFS